MKETLLWIDIETTGLFPDKGYPLEIAYVLTDRKLETLVSGESVVRWEEEQLDMVLNSLAPVAREMHEKNGLLALVKGREVGMSIADIELRFVPDLLTADKRDDYWRPCKLAGSKPLFDRGWLGQWFPALSRLPHYRDFDLNTVRSLLHIPKAKDHQQGHRAMEDLMGDLSLLRRVVAIFNLHDVYALFEGVEEPDEDITELMKKEPKFPEAL